MTDQVGWFVWYELLTTDVAAAKAFYGKVLGWGEKDASTADLRYTVFTAGTASVGGLMELPEEARKMGATPRWVGYVAVNDVDVTAERIRSLGGTVYVPPTDSNIGRISVVADPQTATLAVIKALNATPERLDEPGRVGWHELFAADDKKAFAFYQDVFGWQKVDAEPGSMAEYQLFSAGGQTIGGMFTKLAKVPFPFWLYYFNVGEIGSAVERVKQGGGQIFHGPIDLPGDSSVVGCIDPQGAMFALQGTRSGGAGERAQATEIGWSAQWGGISSRGRLVTKPEG